MSLEVRWSGVCNEDVRRIPWRTAARVCAAVIEFAQTGEGPVESIVGGDPFLFGVRVRGAVAIARVDVDGRAILVLRVYPAR